MDFESDEELKKIRDEFIASLAGRRRAFQICLAQVSAGSEPAQLRSILHRLAGAADTFEVKGLGAVAGQLEDQLEKGVAVAKLMDGIALLIDALQWTTENPKEAEAKIQSDPRWVRILTA